MDSLQIKSGKKRIQITDENGGEKGVLEFNPSEFAFIEKYQELLINFTEKSGKIDELRQAAGLVEVDSENIREQSDVIFTAVKELYDFFENEIDGLFGTGTSAMLFSEERDVDEYHQFLEGIAPYIQGERAKKMARYAPPSRSKKAKKAKL